MMQKNAGLISVFVGLVIIIAILLLSTSSNNTNTQPSPTATVLSPSHTATSITTAQPTRAVTPSDPFGVAITFDYEDSIVGSHVNETPYTNAIPDSWLANPADNARYELRFYFSEGIELSCGLYDGNVTLSFQGVNLRLSVIDRTGERFTSFEAFSPIFPETCPESYTFELINLVAQDAIEWYAPDATEVREWLNSNVRVLSDMPATPTPTPTRTPTPIPPLVDNTLIITGRVLIYDATGEQIGIRIDGEFPLIAVEDEHYIIMYNEERSYVEVSSEHVRPVQPITVESTLRITGRVVINDADGNFIAREDEGEYPLLGIEDDTYVILYNEESVYVDTSTNNASPVQSYPLLNITGTVIIRDTNNQQIAMERAGQYPLISVENDTYVISYDGTRAYVLTSSPNALPARPIDQ